MKVGHRHIIVGMDPGTTVGVAIMDLNGNLLDLFSAKNCSLGEIINRIILHGKPLVVATDVSPTPSAVKKISSVFASVVNELNASMTVEYKERLIAKYKHRCRNTHERDALAACIDAFNRYKKKFAQIRKKMPPEIEDEDEVKAMVVRGISIQRAISMLLNGNAENAQREDRADRVNRSAEDGIARKNDVMVEMRKKDEARLRDLLERLKSELDDKKREIEELRRKFHDEISEMRIEVMRDRRIKELKAEIACLREELKRVREENARLKDFIDELRGENVHDGFLRVIVLRNFSRKEIEEVERRFGLEKWDVVFIEDGSGAGPRTAEMLAERGVAAIIYGRELSPLASEKLAEHGIFAFHESEIPVKHRKGSDFAFVDERALRCKIDECRRGRKERILFSL